MPGFGVPTDKNDILKNSRERIKEREAAEKAARQEARTETAKGALTLAGGVVVGGAAIASISTENRDPVYGSAFTAVEAVDSYAKEAIADLRQEIQDAPFASVTAGVAVGVVVGYAAKALKDAFAQRNAGHEAGQGR